jgi:hypothetical protein
MIPPVLDAPISPLRQRLIDDMNMRRFSRETQRNYLRDDSERMLLRVERGKGGRYRNAMLSEDLLIFCGSGGRSDVSRA